MLCLGQGRFQQVFAKLPVQFKLWAKNPCYWFQPLTFRTLEGCLGSYIPKGKTDEVHRASEKPTRGN